MDWWGIQSKVQNSMTIVTCAPCPLVSTDMRSVVGVDLAMFGGSDILATLFFNGNLTGEEWVITLWLKPELKNNKHRIYVCRCIGSPTTDGASGLHYIHFPQTVFTSCSDCFTNSLNLTERLLFSNPKITADYTISNLYDGLYHKRQ